MKDFITESEKGFNERFTEAIENIEWSWNGGEFVIDDLKTFLRTELLAAYEKGRKDFGEEIAKVMEEKIELHGRLHGSIDCVPCAYEQCVSLIRGSVGEKLPEGQ